MRTPRSHIPPQFQLDAIRGHLIFPVNLHVSQLAETQFVLSKCSPEVAGGVIKTLNIILTLWITALYHKLHNKQKKEKYTHIYERTSTHALKGTNAIG